MFIDDNISYNLSQNSFSSYPRPVVIDPKIPLFGKEGDTPGTT
jgi:hypothetical protein